MSLLICHTLHITSSSILAIHKTQDMLNTLYTPLKSLPLKFLASSSLLAFLVTKINTLPAETETIAINIH